MKIFGFKIIRNSDWAIISNNIWGAEKNTKHLNWFYDGRYYPKDNAPDPKKLAGYIWDDLTQVQEVVLRVEYGEDKTAVSWVSNIRHYIRSFARKARFSLSK